MGGVGFSNPNNLHEDLMTAMAENVLIDQAWFIASGANVPDIHFDHFDEELDHGWHEFHAFVATEEQPNDPLGRSIEEFVEALRYSVLDQKYSPPTPVPP